MEYFEFLNESQSSKHHFEMAAAPLSHLGLEGGANFQSKIKHIDHNITEEKDAMIMPWCFPSWQSSGKCNMSTQVSLIPFPSHCSLFISGLFVKSK